MYYLCRAASCIMKGKEKIYSEMDRLRGYSSAYSRSVFSQIMDHDNFDRLTLLHDRYDKSRKKEKTYLSYIKYMYRKMVADYRCEYVYKNEIINELLLQEYAHKDTVIFNEYRIQKSIVDLVMFNGHSRAFEIKTEYDSTFRLAGQLAEYTKLFQQCYVVVPEKFKDLYLQEVPENVGIIIMKDAEGKLVLEEIRAASFNSSIEVTLMMKCLRTNEYKSMVKQAYGTIPDVSCFEMYDKCEKLLRLLPNDILQEYFINIMKSRKNNTKLLRKVPLEMRQICLQLGLYSDEISILLTKLNKPLKV